MRLALASLCISLVGQISSAQMANGPITLSESDARHHLLQHDDPLYPPIAKAARVQGDVVIGLVINESGQVASEKVVSGPAMLQQAALDAVKKWRFTPFQANGVSTQTATTLTIPFHIDKPGEGPTAEQDKSAQAWFPLSDKCRSAIKAQNAQDALDFCKQALDMSNKAGDFNSSDQLGRVESLQMYGHALIIAHRVQDAIEQENMAVQEAKKCLKESDQEFAMPFFWRAIAEANLGQVDAALADFEISEETHRKAIANLPEMKEMYSKYLASILKTHAALLDQLGRSADAAKLRTEAAAL
jgi:TonB family protein